MIDALLANLRARAGQTALITDDQSFSYEQIAAAFDSATGLPEKACVFLEPRFTAASVGGMLALLARHNIVVLGSADQAELVRAAEFVFNAEDGKLERIRERVRDESGLMDKLFASGGSGLAVLSSGSTGVPKVILHDFSRLLAVFGSGKKQRVEQTIVPPQLIGGMFSLLYTLISGGTLVSTSDNSPDRVARSISRFRAEALSCSPTFLRLFLASRAFERHDIRSLKQINFGSEPVSEGTIGLLQAALPGVSLRQKFGMSEVGLLATKVEAAGSPYIRLEAGEYRIADGMLELKPKLLMLGYLQGGSLENHLTPDGWFRTGDMAVSKGEYFHVQGRSGELINVGGRKVLPQEIEAVLHTLPGVVDVLVEAEDNALIGQAVKASFVLHYEESLDSLKARVREHCRRENLEEFKIPQRIAILETGAWNALFKKQRGHAKRA